MRYVKKRVLKEVSFYETFGFWYNEKNKTDKFVKAYTYPGKLPQKIDENYIFDPMNLKIFLMGLANRDTMLLVGESGSGKTSMIEQVAARLNYNVAKINYDGSLGRGELLGEWVVSDGQMTFKYGLIPEAFKMPGTIILLDEWDAQNKDAAYVLQRPLQRNDRKLHLLETNELISLHSNNIICATSNTNGMGDNTGLYSHATHIQSFAQLNRFSLTFRCKFLTEAQETELLKRSFPTLDTLVVSLVVDYANKLRNAFSSGVISVPFTTRDILNWMEKFNLLGDVYLAADYCFLNRMSLEDQSVSRSLLERSFGVKP